MPTLSGNCAALIAPAVAAIAAEAAFSASCFARRKAIKSRAVDPRCGEDRMPLAEQEVPVLVVGSSPVQITGTAR